VGCAAHLRPYSLKTMKRLLNKPYSPLAAYVPEPDPDSSSSQADSSTVTPAGQSRTPRLPRPAVGPAVGRATDDGDLLKPYAIFSRNLYTSQKVFKGYERKDFEDAWQRYVPFYANATCLSTTAANRSRRDASTHLAEQVQWNQGA